MEEQSGRGFLPKPKRVLPAWMTSSAAQAGQSGVGRKQPLPAADKTKRARTHLPRAGLSSEETRAGLSLEETRTGLSAEETRMGLSSEETRAGLSSEETRMGLSSEETRMGLSSEETRAGLSSEETRMGLSSEETRAGLSAEETRMGLSSEKTRAGLSAELPRAGLSAEENHGDEGSSDSAPRRKRRKMSGDGNVPSETCEAPSPRNHSNSPGEEDCGWPSDEVAPGSNIRPDGTSTAPSQSARPRCPYGEACYRKNPLHFQECSHPGDHDYQQEEEEPEQEVDLPECPYGIDCYREGHEDGTQSSCW
ncbi:hypothetical protein CRUP_011936 [Coryphaenoides rupestris]|nr:hypothetical protein CRUP_011936 [Coryphaenoides rupestris]